MTSRKELLKESARTFVQQLGWKWTTVVVVFALIIGVFAAGKIIDFFNYGSQAEQINILKQQTSEAIERANQAESEKDKYKAEADDFRKKAEDFEKIQKEHFAKYEELKKQANKIDEDISRVRNGDARRLGTLDERVERFSAELDELTRPDSDSNSNK